MTRVFYVACGFDSLRSLITRSDELEGGLADGAWPGSTPTSYLMVLWLVRESCASTWLVASLSFSTSDSELLTGNDGILA